MLAEGNDCRLYIEHSIIEERIAPLQPQSQCFLNIESQNLCLVSGENAGAFICGCGYGEIGTASIHTEYQKYDFVFKFYPFTIKFKNGHPVKLF